MNDTKADSNCSLILPITGSLDRIVYPADFITSAKFLGKTHVGQLDCNHFYAPSVKLSDGSLVQMDVWVDVDQSLPCQISTLDLSSKAITTWAFDGFSSVIPPQATQQCSIPLIMCAEEDWVCNVMSGADPSALQGALGWACSDGKIDCTPINPGGSNFYPDTLNDHCNWAFTAYYLQHRYNQGIDACSFGGLANIAPPSPPPATTGSHPIKRSSTIGEYLSESIESRARRPREATVDKFLHSMAGASVYPYDIVCASA